MAKKYEFQPDRPYATWLNKLQLTPQQQKQVLKWVLYALVLIVLSVAQDVVLSRFRLYGGTSDLVPCGIFIICIMENMKSLVRLEMMQQVKLLIKWHVRLDLVIQVDQK